jgi:hypothetical protein
VEFFEISANPPPFSQRVTHTTIPFFLPLFADDILKWALLSSIFAVLLLTAAGAWLPRKRNSHLLRGQGQEVQRRRTCSKTIGDETCEAVYCDVKRQHRLVQAVAFDRECTVRISHDDSWKMKNEKEEPHRSGQEINFGGEGSKTTNVNTCEAVYCEMKSFKRGEQLYENYPGEKSVCEQMSMADNVYDCPVFPPVPL